MPFSAYLGGGTGAGNVRSERLFGWRIQLHFPVRWVYKILGDAKGKYVLLIHQQVCNFALVCAE
jgi:hypothetical protein